MPEQDPIPPRRHARRIAPGEDDDVPPWASLPPVRPRRHAAPQGPPAVPVTPPGGLRRQGPPSAYTSGPHQVAPYPPDSPRLGAESVYTGRHNSGPMPASGPVPGPGPQHAGLPDGLYLPEDDASVSPPEWAMPAVDDPQPQRRVGAIGDRARRALMRKRRRFYLMAGGVVTVVAAIVATLLLTGGNSQSANISGDLVTTFQAGELQQVPDACRSIPAATIAQYLPGQTKMSAPLPINGKLGSGCNWTLDQPPTYRLLEVNLLAYSPSGLASGDGSATNAAMDAYQVALRDMRQPPKGSPAGTVTVLNGLGDEAFSSMQVFKAGGATTDVATVTFRYRNVIGTATIDGLIAHNSKGSYGPVDQTQLAAAALAIAQLAATSVH